MSAAVPEDSSSGEAGLDPEAQEIVRRFHELYYDTLHNEKSALSIEWLGVSAIKCPFDMWTYQEIIHRMRPDVIVETRSGGTGRPGVRGRSLRREVLAHDEPRRIPEANPG